MPAEPRPAGRPAPGAARPAAWRTDIVTNVVPDAPDDRDLFYEPVDGDSELPAAVPRDGYERLVGVTWHQRGEECTGFALAAIANVELRRHHGDPGLPSVSRRMLYESAQIHDGEDFEEGSTLRGALRGWRRTGVALDELWPYDPGDEHGDKHGRLTLARVLDARHRPLVSYRRIMHDRIELMRRALAEGHVLFAAARTHVGWYRLFLPDASSRIERRPGDGDKGGHAFVIVGYDDDGFWVHNSWGPEWGTEGYAVLPYDDWIRDGHDTWVVDLDPGTLGDLDGPGVDATLLTPERIAAYRDLWPHLVVLRDDGRLAADGLYEMDEGSFGIITFLFGERTVDWQRRRVAVVFDDGRSPTPETIERCRHVRDRYMAAEVYPLFVVWETSWGVELADELERWVLHHAARNHRSEPPYGSAEPFVRDAVRASVARLVWQQLVNRSRLAASPGGGAHTLAAALTRKRSTMDFDLHVVASGVGDLLQTAVLAELPAPVATATVVGSATPLDDAVAAYGAALSHGALDALHLVTVEDGESFATIDGPLLDVVAELLAPTGSEPVALLGRTEGTDLDPLRVAGRVVERTVEAGDADPHAVAIAAMRAHQPSRRPAEDRATAPPASKPSDRLPVDPLARAEALRRHAI